jgi:hypothetical protein
MVDTDGLIQFWGRVPKKPPFVHPEDAKALRDFGMDLAQFGVDLGLYPQPWVGPIKTARAYVLQLNPGLSGPETKIEKTNSEFQRALRDNLKGELPNLFLDDRFTSHPGRAWVESHLRGVAPLAHLAACVAQVELFPYHSATFKIPERMLLALPSVNLIRRWVHDTILPAARSEKVGVVVQRSVKAWNLASHPEGDSIVIYRGAECQGGWVTERTRGGKMIKRILAH